MATCSICKWDASVYRCGTVCHNPQYSIGASMPTDPNTLQARLDALLLKHTAYPEEGVKPSRVTYESSLLDLLSQLDAERLRSEALETKGKSLFEAAVALMGGEGWETEYECQHGQSMGKKCPEKDCSLNPARAALKGGQ